jgi:hypothetical protein
MHQVDGNSTIMNEEYGRIFRWLIIEMGGMLIVVVVEVPPSYFATQVLSPRRDVD